MRFTFVDRVLEFRPGVKITTLKSLSLAEEYLADHFPRFPVMPGVLMLQAMTEASAFLIAATEGFAHGVVTLKEAGNVRFAGFVQPGDTLTVTSEIQRSDHRDAWFKTQGLLDGRVAVNGRLVLERYNLADERPDLAPTDAFLRRHFKERWALVYRPTAELETVGSEPSREPVGAAAEPDRHKG